MARRRWTRSGHRWFDDLADSLGPDLRLLTIRRRSVCCSPGNHRQTTRRRKGSDSVVRDRLGRGVVLVFLLGVILAVLIGWQFTAAELVGGPIMIVLITLIFRLFLRKRMIDDARTQANKNLAGSMEGHAAMDMSIPDEGSLWHRLRSRKAATSISHIFIMEWVAVIRDIVAGLLIAGAIAAWVPDSFWGHFFAVGHPLLS